ncbi:Protein nessun dorma, partial [Armadillidium nasatum]
MEKFCNEHVSQSKNNLQIVRATWDPQDRVKELEEILQDASVDKVEKQFQKYVSESIEPTGWQAVWRSQNGIVSSEKLKTPLDYLVDVVHVSQFELRALVIIKAIINSSSENLILEEHNINKEVSVSLLELYPTSHQENDVINIETTTEILEQIRFFYENIMLPWDSFEEICLYNESLLRNRVE